MPMMSARTATAAVSALGATAAGFVRSLTTSRTETMPATCRRGTGEAPDVAADVAGELRMSKWRVGNGVHPPEVFDGETLRAAVLAALARGYLVRGDVADASSVDGAECGSFRVTEAGAVVEL